MKPSHSFGLSELINGIAHEINNPLMIISGSAQQISDTASSKKESENFDELLKVADRVDRSVLRISKIVKTLRYFSNDLGERENLRSVNLNQFFEDILVFCKEKFRDPQVEKRFQGLVEEVEIICQPSLLCDAFLCLVNNALDAVKKLEERWIEIKIETLQKEIQLSITHSGAKVDTPPNPWIKAAKKNVEELSGTFLLDKSSKHPCFIFKLPKDPQS